VHGGAGLNRVWPALFAIGLLRTFGGDPRPNGLRAILYLVISALGAVVYFGGHDNPVAPLFGGLFTVYVCQLFASLGQSGDAARRVGAHARFSAHRGRRVADVLTVAAALDLARGFDLPLWGRCASAWVWRPSAAPGYIDLRHGVDIGRDRSVAGMRGHTYAVLDAAYDAVCARSMPPARTGAPGGGCARAGPRA
jgi:hypothetical protein